MDSINIDKKELVTQELIHFLPTNESKKQSKVVFDSKIPVIDIEENVLLKLHENF
jgi:hypothetical protein